MNAVNGHVCARLVTGDFITPQFNAQPRFDKPILIYWLMALSVRTLNPIPLTLKIHDSPEMLMNLGWEMTVVELQGLIMACSPINNHPKTLRIPQALVFELQGKLLGPNVWALRLPSAICATGLLLGLFTTVKEFGLRTHIDNANTKLNESEFASSMGDHYVPAVITIAAFALNLMVSHHRLARNFSVCLRTPCCWLFPFKDERFKVSKWPFLIDYVVESVVEVKRCFISLD